MSTPLLQVKNLCTSFDVDAGEVRAVNGISFSLDKGKVLGIVGESGSGKSVTAYSIMRILVEPGRIKSGEILFDGQDIVKFSKKQMSEFRGKRVSIIFQDPMTSLNPTYTIGNQLREAILLHTNRNHEQANARAVEMLKLVGVNEPEKRLKQYPHELSGGMRQRVMIAMALCSNPSLLIADEPTTALDPTIQAQILELIGELQKKLGMSVLYITHDLGVVAELCHRVVVMYAGMVMEVAQTEDLFSKPAHPYTQGLMKAMPRMNSGGERLNSIEGVVPHITEMPKGCHFHPRCPYATELCRQSCPPMTDLGNGHQVRCHLADRGREEEQA